MEPKNTSTETTKPVDKPADSNAERPKEIGGSAKPEPTRYGDWEVDGRCTDF